MTRRTIDMLIAAELSCVKLLPDEMDGEPWSPALLDWPAADFVEHGYDLKHPIATPRITRSS